MRTFVRGVHFPPFVGPIPPELGRLDALEMLNMDDNQLTGESSESDARYFRDTLHKSISIDMLHPDVSGSYTQGMAYEESRTNIDS